MTSTIKKSAQRFNALTISIFALFFVAPLQASDLQWQRQFVDFGGGGKFSTLLIDNGGNAHVSYVDDDLHQLKYAFWDHTLEKWFTMRLDDHAGGFSSMALDSKQHPHVSYLEYGTGRLKYARWDGLVWKSQVIELSARLLEFYTSIALDARDHPIISYYEVVDAEGVGLSLHLRTAKWTGQLWEVSTIDGTMGSGKFNFLMARPNGRLQVAYANVRDENASLRYGTWNGKSWDLEVLEGANTSFYVYNVAGVVDSTDTPHIAYTDVRNLKVKYATQRDGQWQIETVASLVREGYPDRNGIALDEQGTPYISYYDAAQGVLRLAHKEGTTWKAEVVDESFSGFTSSLKIADGHIFITYLDIKNRSLKSARRPLKLAGSSTTGGQVQ